MNMSKPSDYPGFKNLQAIWDMKLKESGFKDVETNWRDERTIKRSGTERRYEKLDPISRDAKLQYYRKVSQFVSRTSFDSTFERNVLTLYSRGVSQVQIKRLLKVSGHRCKIYYPLYRWLRLWGLK